MALLKDTIISGVCRVVSDLFVNGFANAAGFKKSGSSDSFVLLGGGGHKAESSLSVSSAASASTAATLTPTRSPSSGLVTTLLVKNSWTTVWGFAASTLGVYAIEIADFTNSNGTGAVNYYAGVIMLNGSTGRLDEVALHSAMATSSDTQIPRRLFAATDGGVLKLSSMDDTATNHYLVLKKVKLMAI